MVTLCQIIALLLISLLVTLVLVGGLAVYAVRMARQRRRIQRHLFEAWGGTIPHHECFAVRLCDPARFRRFWKFFPWNRAGILLVGEQEATLVVDDPDGDQLLLRYPRVPEFFGWIGRKFWPNGNLYWLLMENAGQAWYVTSETGVTIFGSKLGTRKIYDTVRGEFPEGELSALPGAVDFALEKHPLSLGMLVLFFVLLVYALLDGFFINEEVYVHFPFLSLTVLTGVVVAGVCGLLVYKSRVPNAIGLVLALMLAAAAGGSLYPGLLRLNQLTSALPPQPYSYRVDFELQRLVPFDPDLPVISYPMAATSAYWLTRDLQSPYPVELRKGGLGFYQINMTPIYNHVGEFYRELRRTRAISNKALD